MPKVFVLNRGSHDYEKASRFGELVYVTDGMLSKLSVGTMYRTLMDAFKNSQPSDYILLSSLTTLCAIATALFAVQHGRLNLLIYHNGDYVMRQILFHKDAQNDKDTDTN